MARKEVAPFIVNEGSLRKLLLKNGWHQQERIASECTSRDASIVISWWNRGADVRLLIEQDEVGGMLFQPLTSKASIIRSLEKNDEDDVLGHPDDYATRESRESD